MPSKVCTLTWRTSAEGPRKINQRKGTWSVSANVDVGFEIRNEILVSCTSLNVHGFEEQFERLFEPGLRPRSTVRDTTWPETAIKAISSRFRLRLKICFFEAKGWKIKKKVKKLSNSLSSEFAWVKFLLGLFLSWKDCRYVFARKPESIHDAIGKDIRVACHHAIANVIPIRVSDMSASELWG